MAQDDYYYEIQLTNKQLVFYFMAGASGLILSFLAGIMVGRGVDTSDAVQAAGPRSTIEQPADRIITEDPPPTAPKSAPVPAEDLRYASVLEADRPADTAAAPESKPKGSVVIPVATLPPATNTRRTEPSAKPVAVAAESTAGAFTLQVGAFKEKAYADSQVGNLKKKGYAAYVVTPDGGDSLFNVRVGTYATRASAEKVQQQLLGEKLKPFIVERR